MALPVNVGQELLNVPFPEMIQQLALAIAEGQLALDMNSIDVARALATTTLPANSVVVAMQETVDEDGNVTKSEPVFNAAELSLLAFGLNPTFYQFTESIIEVKMEITMRLERTFETSTSRTFKFENKTTVDAKAQTGGIAAKLFGKASVSAKNTTTVAYSTTMNARYTNKYSVEAHGTSLLRTTLNPVPPPERSVPRFRVTAPAAEPEA
jgi:hypothetical protein